MALIRGGPAGPDGSGGAYDNEVETDRSAWWAAMGGKQCVIKGFTHSGVPGSMALDFTAGSALVGERAADGSASLDRGYFVWADVATTVTFDPASVSTRNDAVVACFVDVEDGPVGTGGLDVGPHLVVVPGVSGTTTPRTDAQINTWLGRGGWGRLLDVPVAPAATEINVATIVRHLSAPKARAKIRALITQAVPDTTFRLITYGDVVKDTAGMVDLVTVSNGITVTRDGAYLIRFKGSMGTSAVGRRIATVEVNNIEVDRVESAAGLFWIESVITDLDLVVGDVVRGKLWQSSGGSLDTYVGSLPELSVLEL